MTDRGADLPGEPVPGTAAAQRGELVVVTGMTGAGRSTAAKELEDLGFFVVDNLPPALVPDVVRMVDESHGPDRSIAVVVDVRSGDFFESLREVLKGDSLPRRTTLLYLEAQDDVLVRRQEAARRPHPLQGSGRLLDGLAREREVMASLRSDADLVIDTSDLNVHQLTGRIADYFGTAQSTSLKVNVVSFGFKYGLPLDADMVVDVRFLPNPHWVAELRPHTGRDAPVRDYVLAQDGAAEFLDRYEGLLRLVFDGYAREGKRYALAAVGCTGGKHRSVAMTEQLAGRLAGDGVDVSVVHRDLGRE